MSYTAALYLRVSVDDDNRDESNSIANQRDLLSAYTAADPVLSSGEIMEFADDGWSGTTFERPGVKELLDLARRGGIQCILVKDMSRWGRNYVEVIEHIEQIFPFLGIRFISVTDRYDSTDYKGQTAPLDISFNSLAHDIYCKELSEKVRQSYFAKAKKGEFLCGVAPFGYVKSNVEKNKLLIDEEAAGVVRRIFTMACEGLTTTQIAAVLNGEGVDTPLMYRKRTGRVLRGDHSAVGEVGFWKNKSVQGIIGDEGYVGFQVTGKTRKPKPGSRNAQCQPRSEWIRVPGAHEAIISEEVYSRANAGIRHSEPTGAKPTRHVLFSGKVYCGHCGRTLRRQLTKSSYYYCNGTRLNNGAGCSDGRLYVSDLKDIVLAALKAETRKVLEERSRRRQTAKCESSSREATLSEHKQLIAHISLLERRSVMLYEDYADGKLGRDEYLAEKTACLEDIAAAEARSAELNRRLAAASKASNTPNDEPVLRQMLDAVDVTDEMLDLIERIVMFDPGRIEIHFTIGDTNTIGIE